MYSDNAADYTRLPPIGFGASSIVYQAVYHYKDPQTGKVKDLPCALKVLNLDKLAPPALRLLTRETQLMSLNKVSENHEWFFTPLTRSWLWCRFRSIPTS